MSGDGNPIQAVIPPALAAALSPVEVTGNQTALLNRTHLVTATATLTDPTPVQGRGYEVIVRNGTATVGGTAYAAGLKIRRYYHSGAWANSVEPSHGGTPTTGRHVEWDSSGNLVNSQLADSTTGGVLTIAGTLTADRTWTYPDRSDTVAGLAAQTFAGVQTFAAGSAAAPSIVVSDSGLGFFRASTNILGIATAGTEAVRFDASQRTLIGAATAVATVVGTARVQIHGLSQPDSGIVLANWTNGATGDPQLSFCKSNSGVVGTFGAIGSNNEIATIRFEGDDGTAFATAAQLQCRADGAISTGIVPGHFRILTATTSGTLTESVRWTSAQDQLNAGHVRINAASKSFGHTTGAGGSVTQATSKATGVTLNTATGRITMNAAALAADTGVAFVVTNSAIEATDILIVVHESAGTLGAYGLAASCAAGSATITVRNVTPGSLSEAIVLRFILVKSTVT